MIKPEALCTLYNIFLDGTGEMNFMKDGVSESEAEKKDRNDLVSEKFN